MLCQKVEAEELFMVVTKDLDFIWPKNFTKLWNGNLFVKQEGGGGREILADKFC